MSFKHRIYNQEGKLANDATVVLVFMDAATGRPVRAPEKLIRLLSD